MKILLVMDKEVDGVRNSEILDIMKAINPRDNRIVYTEYEDESIRKIRNYRYIGSFLQHIMYWKKSFGYAINILKTDADVIYCINPIVGIFLGIFNRKKRIILSGFLFEPKRNKIYYNLRKAFATLSLRGIDKVIVYGSREVEYYESLFHCKKFLFMKYGIDYEKMLTYKGHDLPREYIFSGGGSNRDYQTLLNAYNKCEKVELPLVIATQPWRIEKFNTSQVILLDDVQVENFGDVLKRSKLLVLSLKDRNISAGHMVMFQAMSLNVPILVNDIAAIRDYVDEDSVVFYSSGNVDELHMLLERFREDETVYTERARKAQEIYQNELTFDSMLERFLVL